MSETRNFDDFIKKEFSNYSPDVGPHIWENIIAEREKRKPGGLWLNFLNGRNILLLTALLLTGTAGIFLLHTNSNDKKTNTGNNRVASNKMDYQTKTGNNSINKTDQTAENDLINSQKNVTTAQIPSSNIFDANNNNNDNDNDLTNNINNNRNKKIAVDENFASQSAQNLETVNNSPGDPNTQGSLLGRLLYGAQKILSLTMDEPELKNRVFPNVSLPGCPTVEKDAAGNKKYFELYAGPDYAFRSFSDTPNSVYLQKRKESTKFYSAYSAGIRYTKVFKNAMSFKTGFNYSQINEKFSFIQTNLVQVTYIIDPVTGDTTGSYTVRGARYKTTYNHYRTFDIPLLMGYELGNGRLHANINAGGIINVYSWQKGDVLDTSFQPVSITTGKGVSSYQYKNNLGLGLTGGVSLYYKLNDFLHLLAEPYFRYNLSPMNKDNLTLRQKYSTLGLRLGVRFDIE